MGGDVYASLTARPLVFEVLKRVAKSDDRFMYHPELEKIVIDEITGRPADPRDPQAIEILVPKTT